MQKTHCRQLVVLAAWFAANLIASDATQPVTDMRGRSVIVPAHIQKICCIGRGSLRMVSYLHAADLVTGVEFPEKKETPHARPYLLAYPFLRDLPLIGFGAAGDPELILQAGPEVILYADGDLQAIESMQGKTGIPVVAMTCGDLSEKREDFNACLRLLGKILNKEARADSLIGLIDSEIQEINMLTAQNRLDTLSAYIGGLVFKGRHGFNSTEADYAPFNLLGIKNVAAGIPSAPENPVQIQLEQLVVWKPDVVFYDMACEDKVADDLRKYRFLKFKGVYSLYPSRLYGENFETTLLNAFYIAYALTGRKSDFDGKIREIYTAFLTPETAEKFIAIYGMPERKQ